MLIDYWDADREIATYIDRSQIYRQRYIQTIIWIHTEIQTDIQTVMLIDYRDTDRDIATYIDRSQIYRQRYRPTDNYIDRLQC